MLQQIIFVNRFTDDANVMLLAEVKLWPQPIDIKLQIPGRPPITETSEMIEKGRLFFRRFAVRAGSISDSPLVQYVLYCADNTPEPL
jgi:hypothetical protein